jgi:hypothetical protein
MTQQTYANANAKTMQNALATVGWTDPAAGVPIAPWALPVIVIGGAAVPAYKTQWASTIGVLANGTYTVYFTVPTGKQWKVVSVSGLDNGATGFCFPSWQSGTGGPALNTLGRAALSVTPFPGTPNGAGAIIPAVADVGRSTPIVVLGPGDTMGVLLLGGADASQVVMSISYEESNIP